MQEYRMKKDQPKYSFTNDMIIFTENRRILKGTIRIL